MLLSILASIISPSENVNFYHFLSELYDVSPQDFIKLMELKKIKLKNLRILIDGIAESKYKIEIDDFSPGFLKKCELIKKDMDYFSEICISLELEIYYFKLLKGLNFDKIGLSFNN